MRTNGTLQYAIIAEGGLDELGEVVEAQLEWSAPIPCSIHINSDNRLKAFAGGVYHDVSLSVLIESPSFYYPKVRVLDSHNQLIGEYNVLSVVPSGTFNRTQILL